jgi:ADP-heptose:LPS heptosyltransferase
VPGRAEPPLRSAKRPVLFYANGIGDDLLNLPALRALATAFEGRLRLLTSRGSHAFLFDELPLAQRLEIEMSREPETGERRFDAAAAARAIGSCDLLLSILPWHSRSVDELLARLAPRRSSGFSSEFDIVFARGGRTHAAHVAFEAARAVAPEAAFEAYASPPAYPGYAVAFARRLRARLPARAQVLAVHADTKADKTWPAERFGAVLEVHLRRHPSCYAFVVGGAGAPAFDALDCAARVIDCSRLALATSCALVAAAEWFVGVDSSMLHVADLARVPSVALFGGSDPDEFGPLFADHRVVRGTDGMGSISAADVSSALEDLAARGGVRARGG